MGNWERKKIDLGIIKERTKVQFVYKANKSLDIVKIKAGCSGCVKVGNFDKDKLELPVTYTANSIPAHFLQQGKVEQDITKSVLVKYKDNTEEVLLFTAKIKR